MEAKTTLTYRGIQYPFYKTNRGTWDFEAFGFTNNDLINGSGRALLALTYFQLRDCAKRAGLTFKDSLDDFIDNADTDVIGVFARLKTEKGKTETGEGKQEAGEGNAIAPTPITEGATE